MVTTTPMVVVSVSDDVDGVFTVVIAVNVAVAVDEVVVVAVSVCVAVEVVAVVVVVVVVLLLVVVVSDVVVVVVMGSPYANENACCHCATPPEYNLMQHPPVLPNRPHPQKGRAFRLSPLSTLFFGQEVSDPPMYPFTTLPE